jgi:hypothetical protein
MIYKARPGRLIYEHYRLNGYHHTTLSTWYFFTPSQNKTRLSGTANPVTRAIKFSGSSRAVGSFDADAVKSQDILTLEDAAAVPRP